MRVIEGLDALAPPPGGSSVVIGTFDGVHRGHHALIGRAVDDANEHARRSVCVTWDRHPTETLAPSKTPPLLTTLERKMELLAATGLDIVAVLEFDDAFTKWPPRRFVEDVLADGLGARSVFVGSGFRFGHKAAGDIATLQQLGRWLGFAAEAAPLFEAGGEPVSSTRVRRAVAAGDLELAADLLGRPFEVEAEVVRGDARGAALGYPTANLPLGEGMARVPNGVYGGCAQTKDGRYPAAVNVGVNPTFTHDKAARPRLEAHLLDFTGDLYSRPLRIELITRLRDETRFASAEELIIQIKKDVEATRSLTC